MNDDYYSTPKARTNNFMPNNNIPNPPIHLFTKPSVLSPPIGILKVQCKNRQIPIQIHQNPRQLSQLINNSTTKTFIIIQTPRESSTQISNIFPQTYSFQKVSSENIKILTYPNSIPNTTYQTAKDYQQILSQYDKYFVGIKPVQKQKIKQSSKIKLRSIHSSKDIKYQLSSPQNKKSAKKNDSNKQVFFQKLLYNDYNTNPNSLYRSLIQSIKNTHKIQPLTKYQDIKLHIDKLQKQTKLLLLVDQENLNRYKNYVSQQKLTKKIVFIVFGQFQHPSKFLLDQSVYFASSNGIDIIDKLSQLGFQRMFQKRQQYMKLSTDQKNRFRFSQQMHQGTIQPYIYTENGKSNDVRTNGVNNLGYDNFNNQYQQAGALNNINPIKSYDKPELYRVSQKSILSNSSSVMERYMRTWTIDIDPKSKDPKNAPYIMTQEGRHQIDTISQPLSKRASRLTVGYKSRHSSSMDSDKMINTLKGTQQNYGYDQNMITNNDARIRTKQSDVNILMPAMSNQFQFVKLHNSHHNLQKQQSQNTTVLQQKSNKKIITIGNKKPGQQQNQQYTSSTSINSRHQTKHQQIPSNVIQQMSDQYRGSNRESIVNMDDHIYHHYGGSTHSPTNSGNNINNSGGTMNPSQSFSRFKNAVTMPAEQLGYKRVVTNNDRLAPVENTVRDTKDVFAVAGRDYKSKDLPIYSPSHSEIKDNNAQQLTMQPILIDGLKGEVIGNGLDTLRHQLNMVNSNGKMPKPVAPSYSKNSYQTTTVHPYGPTYQSSFKPSSSYQLSQKNSSAFIINGSTGQLQQESYRRLQQIKKSDQTHPYVTPTYLPSSSNYNNNSKMDQQNIRTTFNPTSSNNMYDNKTYVINGSTGELDPNSQKRLKQLKASMTKHEPYITTTNQATTPITTTTNNTNYKYVQNVIRPSHYIEPQIVKIPYNSDSRSSLRSQNIATQKKIIPSSQNNYYTNTLNNNTQSTTSIRILNNNNNVNKANNETSSNLVTNNYSSSNNNGNPLSNRYQYIHSNNPTATNTKYQTTTTNYVSSSASKNPQIRQRETRYVSPSYQTSSSSNNNNNTANYKVYTAEQYNLKYGGGNSTSPITYDSYSNNRVIPSTSNHTSYSSYNNNNTHNNYNNVNNNYHQTTTRTSTIVYNESKTQPQVINRVYIKASDLPDRVVREGQTGSINGNTKVTTTTTNVRRYDNLSPSHHTYTKQYTTKQDYNNTIKLSAQDLDPFNEHLSPSKYSTMKKKSYLMRKQDGKRDPYSPYDENGPAGSRIAKGSGMKTYTVEEYSSANQNLNSNGIDLNKYQKVIENGVTVYKTKSTSTYDNYSVPQTRSKVIETNQLLQPSSRENYHQSTSRPTIVNGYQTGGITRYEPTGREYANSPTRRQGSSYQRGLTTQNPLRRNSQDRGGYFETVTTTTTINNNNRNNIVPLKAQQLQIKPLVYDSKSPMKVSQYRATSNNQNTYTYQSPTKHVVARRDIVQPRVQASNFNTRITDFGPNKKVTNQNEIGVISGIQQKNSEIFELSDGSIMRRNNIKFGINKYRNSQAQNNKFQDSYEYLQQMKSKIKSKIITISQINRNYSIQKKLLNQDQVQFQKQAYSYINTSVNEFYFLVDEQLQFLQSWLVKFLKSPNDRIQKYRGIDQMYYKIEQHFNSFDVIFLLVKKQDINKINKRIIPQDCFIIQLMPQQYKGLQISQKQKIIKLSKLPYLKLAQKIIIQTMLNHIILYQKFNTATNRKSSSSSNSNNYFQKQITHLLSLFPQGHFIKQSYEQPLTLEVIYGLVDDPKFNRLYVICDEKEMVNVVKQLEKIDQRDAFPKEICKIICVPSEDEILKFEEKIEKYPKVAWMTNVSKIHDYKSLIKYALRQDEDDNLYAKKEQLVQQIQKIYYHSRHRNLTQAIQKIFPSRFQFQIFNSLADIQKKIIKSRSQLNSSNKLISTKQRDPYSSNHIKKTVTSPNKRQINTINYLILHPILSEEYIETKLFKKIYMLGKSDKIQRKVIKVGNVQQLVQLLKK